MSTIGRSEVRRDSVKLATGRGTFTDDIAVRGVLHGFVLTSPHPHAQIVRVNTELARSMPGVVAVITHEDVPSPVHQASPLLSPHLRFVGDRVALIAAEDLELAQRAAEAIDVQYELLPPTFDEPAPGTAAPYAEVQAAVGDAEAAFSTAEMVLARTYSVPRVAQTAIEPQVVVSWLDEDERLIVRTSSHVPFQVRHLLARRLGLPVRRIRVLSPRDGGGFGGRIGVEIEDLCAALVLRSGRPVRLARTREQELVGARSGHAATITVRSAVAHGELLALDMSVTLNAGAAQDDWSGIALRAAGGVLGLYRCPNVRFRGQAFASNLPPAGALRGDGLAQATFALESHVDEVAARLGEDPLAFRARHHVREGDAAPLLTALGGPAVHEVAVRSCGLEEALAVGARAIGWSGSREPPALGQRPQRRGLGVALAIQAPGAIGAEMTSATIDMLEDGSFHLFVGTADMGAGTETVLCQIAAEVLEASIDSVVVHSADTDVVPFASGPTRSSALFVSGLAVRDAALQVRARLIERAAQMMAVAAEEVTLSGAFAHSRHHRLGYDEIGRAMLMSAEPTPVTGTTSRAVEDAAPPPFAAVFAEVEVDVETGVVRVLKLVEAVDCGQVLNPQIAEARITGGALQGMGSALTEAVTFDDQGRSLARSLREYAIPTVIDSPQIQVHLIPTHEPSGPFGAKSIAEVPILAVAPAIANAVAHAVGARVMELPLTPERVLAAIQATQTRS
jgi:putative selenate reductase molybdopterin-binding subunit